jgi:hypothetical protein
MKETYLFIGGTKDGKWVEVEESCDLIEIPLLVGDKAVWREPDEPPPPIAFTKEVYRKETIQGSLERFTVFVLASLSVDKALMMLISLYAETSAARREKRSEPSTRNIDLRPSEIILLRRALAFYAKRYEACMNETGRPQWEREEGKRYAAASDMLAARLLTDTKTTTRVEVEETTDSAGDWQCFDNVGGWITCPDRQAAERYQQQTGALMRYRRYYHPVL